MIGNLLSLAQGLVGTQPVQWCKYLGRASNAAGYQVATYDAAQDIEGTVQPVPQKLFQQLGLDWQKRYVTLWTPSDVVAVGRDETGDQIVFGGDAYNCESDLDWRPMAGWRAILCAKART